MKKSRLGQPSGFSLRPKGGDALPWKPRRPCSRPGCPELVDGRFCEQQRKEEHQRYNKYDRDPKSRKRYGRRWRKIRDRYISSHPLCEQCLKHDVMTAAEEVHHITPLSQGGTHADENLMSLCKSCHSRITALEGGRWG